VNCEVAARLHAQAQERGQHFQRDKPGAAADNLAVIHQLPGRQRVLDPPGHPDRVVVLEMLGDYRLPLTRNRLAQAWHAQPGGKRRAEADFVDESERALLTADAAGRYAAESQIAMALER